ncbi:MAG: patatin-like phospholipase family protein [Solirubrobacteraceae bacterium]
MRTAFFLRNVPVLAGLSDELLEQLAAQVSELRLPAARWIMREGDVAESMFIVRGGRIEVVHEGPPETLLRVLRRGDVLGELALLREGVRAASARTQRDTELLELGRADFERLIERAPSFALGLTRALGAQVAASRSPFVPAIPPRTIAVVGLDQAALTDEIGDSLADALAAHGPVARLREGELAAIDQAERDSNRVVLIAAGSTDAWTRLCVAECDVVVALTTGKPDPVWTAEMTGLRDCELLVLGSGVDAGTLATLQPREVQVVAPGARQAALELLARRLAGRSLGIVFSGGGARALAHVGVLEELQSAGVRFDRFGGVSLGSLIAAMAAMGLDSEAIVRTCEQGFVTARPTNDFTLPAYSLIRGAKTRRLLRERFGELAIEELPKRFFALSCDLIAREPVVRRTGRLRDAVYSSLAIPGVFPPVTDGDGRLLVDGGVLDNLPVATMARSGEGPVVAVDVTGQTGQFKRGGRPTLARFGRPLRRVLTGSEDTIPRLGETIVRSITVGSTDTVAAARLHADLVITPAVAGVALLDWKVLPRVRELGRAAARQALAADPDLPARLGA